MFQVSDVNTEKKIYHKTVSFIYKICYFLRNPEIASILVFYLKKIKLLFAECLLIASYY